MVGSLALLLFPQASSLTPQACFREFGLDGDLSTAYPDSRRVDSMDLQIGE
jgi:hypothetical protein